ncbi:MAG: hypothetical protein JNM76_10330 [Betaproteobacteria bacterium]|nr:hypothetical protein [Betaproteobacteria bacterium]
MDDSVHRPGRTCPLSYRYSPTVFDRAPDIAADTLYVIGGLYGNPFALAAVLTLAAREPTPPMLVFNGDFNWFDIDPDMFRAVNEAVLSHVALRGNVETELAADDDQGCGCGYPDDVSDAEVERSNVIMRQLRTTARQHANIRNRLAALPMHAVAKVGEARIGIVHGDAESLAGWGFAHDQLDSPERLASLMRIFAKAEVDVFASSHTCLPALRQFPFGAVINNGATGMPNFAGDPAGLITRIGVAPSPHQPAYGARQSGAHVDALRVEFDVAAWTAAFEKQWPAGSAGHVSYWKRITQGPAFTPDRANAT